MSHIGGTRAYSRAEYLSDAVVHASGIGAALIGGPILIALAAVWTGDPSVIAALVLYTVTMVAMWSCSAAYNLIRIPSWVDRLRRLDQSAIYLKIAGTYTPFVALGTMQLGFLAAIWSVAIGGASLVLLSVKRRKALVLLLYLALGWAGAVLGGPLVSTLSDAGFWLLAVGGLLYSGGVTFLLWHRLPFHNTIWHLCVLVATALCFSAIAVELVGAVQNA